MSVQVENLEKNMAKLTIEVAAEKVEDAIQAAYMKEKGKISVPGFRKGKVPRKMIEKMYGAGVFYEDAANTLIQENYAQAVEESGVDVVSRPTIEVVQIEAGKPFILQSPVSVMRIHAAVRSIPNILLKVHSLPNIVTIISLQISAMLPVSLPVVTARQIPFPPEYSSLAERLEQRILHIF